MPSKCLLRSHGSESLAVHTPRSTVHTGSSAARPGSVWLDRHRSKIGTADSWDNRRKETLEFFSGNRRFSSRHGSVESDQHIEAGKLTSLDTKRFANDALKIVAIDSPRGKPPADYDPDAGATASVAGDLHDESIAACAALGA